MESRRLAVHHRLLHRARPVDRARHERRRCRTDGHGLRGLGGMPLRRMRRVLLRTVRKGRGRRSVRHAHQGLQCRRAPHHHAPDVQGILRTAAARPRHRDAAQGMDESSALPHRLWRHLRLLRLHGRRIFRPPVQQLCDFGPRHSDDVPDDVGRLRFCGSGDQRKGVCVLFLRDLHVPHRSRDVVDVDRHHHGRLCRCQAVLEEQRARVGVRPQHPAPCDPECAEAACQPQQSARRYPSRGCPPFEDRLPPGFGQRALCAGVAGGAGEAPAHGGGVLFCGEARHRRVARRHQEVHGPRHGELAALLQLRERGLLHLPVPGGRGRHRRRDEQLRELHGLQGERERGAASDDLERPHRRGLAGCAAACRGHADRSRARRTEGACHRYAASAGSHRCPLRPRWRVALRRNLSWSS
mmetsp:Transcript_10890/g.29840  ORF Transcript_10890/g.29840 Transcript_10890/m.29840 type:complete len:412 (-) Transcript_10890:186-1421(-)